MVTGDSLRIGGDHNGLKAGHVPTDDDLYWIGAMREVFTGAMRTGQQAALAVLVCALAGWLLVVASLTFGNKPSTAIGMIVWLLPLVWWTGSIV